MGKIIVLDDELFFADIIKSYLELAGFEPLLYSSSDDIKTFYNSISNLNNKDIVLLDLMVPKLQLPDSNEGRNLELDGGEFIYNKIREKSDKIKIIIITGKTNNRIAINYKHDSNCEIFFKPLHNSDIKKIISHIKGNL